jgi:hypothetical protein
MKIKTTHCVIFLPLILIFLSKGEAVRSTVEQGEVIQKSELTASAASRQLREEAKNARRFSKVAIERLKANCIRTVDVETEKEAYYFEGALVLDNQLKRPLRPGAFVCNSLGETAVIAVDGSISEIARVALKDKPEYDKLFKSIEGGINSDNSNKGKKK